MPYGFKITRCKGWDDITGELDDELPPWTLAKLDGFGAFQVSVASYSVEEENPLAKDLLATLLNFSKEQNLGPAEDIVQKQGELQFAAATFRDQGNFIRIWYLSDGSDLAYASYICEEGKEDRELDECEKMIATLRFTD